MLKILIVARYYKPGFRAGGPIQSIYNLCKLVGDSMELYVLTQSKDLGSERKMEVVENKWLKFENHFVKYLDIKNFNGIAVYRECLNLDASVVYCNSIFEPTTWMFKSLRPFLTLDVKIIIAPRGELDKGALRFGRFKKHVFLFFYKLFLNRSGIFHATSEKEMIEIRYWFPNQIVVVENVPSVREHRPVKIEKVCELTNIAFISRISPKKNLKLCLDILSILEIDGVLNFDIIGPIEDESYWKSTEKLFKKLPKNVFVQYLGEIRHENLLEMTRHYHYLFLPTLGENYGHIIYECLSYGIPVIISDKTPWKQEENGVYVLDLDDPLSWKHLIECKHKVDNFEYDIDSNLAFNFAKNRGNYPNLLTEYKHLFNEYTK